MAQTEHERPVVYTVTTAAERPDLDVSARTRRYVLTMTIRTVCFVLAIVTHGWVRWACFVGACVLPYVAVVLANARRPQIPGQVEDPVVPPSRQLEPPAASPSGTEASAPGTQTSSPGTGSDEPQP